MQFETINRAYNSTFQPNKLSIGIVIPIENYAHSSVPTMKQHLQRVQFIEELGFAALWVRDVPFHVPSFGDAGQTFDPFTYLGFLAGQTNTISLGISSIALPLHQPVHVAKSASTIDQLSGGRLLMGVASGDRYEEYPAMGLPYESRGEQFRDSFTYIRKANQKFPNLKTSHYGELNGSVDILPKSTGHKIPMLVTGYSRQTLEWNANNSDGWMNYPRSLTEQKDTIQQWRALIDKNNEYSKPYMQPLYIVLENDDDFEPQPIQLGFRIGINYLIEYFNQIQAIGVNHVAINLRFNSYNMEKTLEKLATYVLPQYQNIL